MTDITELRTPLFSLLVEGVFNSFKPPKMSELKRFGVERVLPTCTFCRANMSQRTGLPLGV